MNSKKRKSAVASLEDRTLFQAFTQSANAVSQLYTAAVQAQRRAEESGARQALERVAQFVVKEYGNAPAVPTAVLMEVLRQELQAAQGSTAAVQLPFPLPLLPTGEAHSDAHSDDEALMSGGEAPSPAAFRRTPSGHTISPPKGPGRAPPGGLPALFHQQQAQAQAQQQQQAAAMQHAALMAQMQQQQQQQQAAAQHAAQQQQQQQQQPGAGFAMPGFGGAPPFQ